MKVVATRQPALEGIMHLVKIPGSVTAEELGYLTHNVNELITELTTDMDDLRSVPLKS
jgi:hypothetical protein